MKSAHLGAGPGFALAAAAGAFRQGAAPSP